MHISQGPGATEGHIVAEQYGAREGRDVPEGTEPRPEPRFTGFSCPDVYRRAQSRALRSGDADILIWAVGRVEEARRASWESRGYQQWGRGLSGFLSPL